MAPGCFSTYIKVPELACVRLDDAMSFEVAAALPSVYTTAYMALVDKANLQKGQVRKLGLSSREARFWYTLGMY